jgi:hypothetical protein
MTARILREQLPGVMAGRQSDRFLTSDGNQITSPGTKSRQLAIVDRNLLHHRRALQRFVSVFSSYRRLRCRRGVGFQSAQGKNGITPRSVIMRRLRGEFSNWLVRVNRRRTARESSRSKN